MSENTLSHKTRATIDYLNKLDNPSRIVYYRIYHAVFCSLQGYPDMVYQDQDRFVDIVADNFRSGLGLRRGYVELPDTNRLVRLWEVVSKRLIAEMPHKSEAEHNEQAVAVADLYIQAVKEEEGLL